MSNEIKVKPCPFCGGVELIMFERIHYGNWYYIECGYCEFHYREDVTPEGAAEAWNRRDGESQTQPTFVIAREVSD